MRISLSEAIERGNMLGAGGDALIAALKGLGALPADLDSFDRFFEPDLPGSWTNTYAYPEEALERRRPWLNETLLCPWCAKQLSGAEIVSHPAECPADEVEIEDECEWLAQMEAEPETRSKSLAVYFPNAMERRAVLDAAQRIQMSPSAFIAAALRLVLEFRIRLTCDVIQ